MSTRAQLLAEIAAQFPDNTTGLITPAKLRQVTEDIANSCAVPAAGTGSVAAADITNASASGITVLTGTPAQARTALGFGGTVTVAQLNALAASELDKSYYCSDCLTVNGPGSVVSWCSRTLTWRTMDDCLLATTDFAMWSNDFITNGNANEIRGRKGALWAALENGNNVTLMSQVGTGSSVAVQWDSTIGGVARSLATGASSATAYAREYSTAYQRADTGIKMFAGVRAGYLSSVGTGFTFRIGFSASPTNTLQAEEDSLVYDVGNILGALNPSNLQQWLVCVRTGSVNQAGSGPSGISPVINTPATLLVTRQAAAVAMYQNGTMLGGGTGGVSSQLLNPFCAIANDGTATASVATRQLAFCFGYLLP